MLESYNSIICILAWATCFTASKFCSSEFIFGIPFKNRFRYNFNHLNWMWFQLKPFNSHILYLCTATSRRTYLTQPSNRFDSLLLVTCTAMAMPCETIPHIGASHLQSQFYIFGMYGWHNNNMFPNCLPVAVQGKSYPLAFKSNIVLLSNMAMVLSSKYCL